MSMDGWGTVKHFIDAIKEHGRRDAFYRGQANQEWPLQPSIFRPNACGIRHIDTLNWWKRRASYFANPLPHNDIEWLILAQHYGLHTPLLDWTTNPLVALFFACNDPNAEDKAGCVWLTRRADFKHADHTLMVDPFEVSRDKPLLINAVGMNARSTAQDSYMSLHTEADCDSLEAHRIFTVPPESKKTTVFTLEMLGMTSERLYSDIPSLVETFKKSLKLSIPA